MASIVNENVDWKNPNSEFIQNNTTYNLLSAGPSWTSFIIRGGYARNFVFDNQKWLLSPAILAGAGGLIEKSTSTKDPQLVTDIRLSLNGGLNATGQYYIRINSSWSYRNTNLLLSNLNEDNLNITITAGYRFKDFKQNILDIL